MNIFCEIWKIKVMTKKYNKNRKTNKRKSNRIKKENPYY